MKSFDELTDQEVYDLTDEQLEYHKKIACAEAGAPIAVPPLPERPVEPELHPDAMMYRVNVGWSDSLCFTTMEEAVVVCTAINAGCRLNTRSFGSGKTYVVENREEVKIESKPVFSEAYYKKIKDEAEAYSLKKKEYDEADELRKKAIKAQDSAIGWITERLETARENVRVRMEQESALDEYMNLADANVEVAYRFFVKAYGQPSDAIKEHLRIVYDFQVPEPEAAEAGEEAV
ncbi:MAG: hypothetical protein C4542_03045 [Dehalococcoidia bacterium]|nr:MAG: hypothetical protein C4542_03045 [Dehalococcoidia bacterium]